MNMWKDIDSAPRDGTPILGFADGEMTTVAFYVNGDYWSLCVSGTYVEDDEWNPTHWMPLPNAPAST